MASNGPGEFANLPIHRTINYGEFLLNVSPIPGGIMLHVYSNGELHNFSFPSELWEQIVAASRGLMIAQPGTVFPSNPQG